MKKALVVSFHRQPPFLGDNYRIILEFFKKEMGLWGAEIDKLYFIDSNGFLYPGEERGWQFPCEVEVIHTQNLSHADNFNLVVPRVTEDWILLIDADTLILKKKKISQYFGMLHTYDVVSMIERPDENRISRFSPYFCFIRRETLHRVSPIRFDPEPPIHLDPLAKLTHQLLETVIRYGEIHDDRSTIQMDKSGVVLRTPDAPNETGVYHIRNFNGGIHIIDSMNCDRPSYERDIRLMPPTEVTRLFGWLWVMNCITIDKQRIRDDILLVVDDLDIPRSRWFDYLEEFKLYHSYLYI